jgi:hypothetical protein
MTRNKYKDFAPILILFMLVSALIGIGRHVLDHWKVDQGVVIAGNALLFVITFASFLLAKKGMTNKNPNVFFRSVYSSIMIKLFACIIAAFIYIAIYKSNLNKPALFICMGLYLVYTFMEVAVLTKLLKLRENE